MDQRLTEHRPPEAAEGRHIEVSPTEARQATREGVTRYVLMGSLALVIIAFAIAYLVFF